MEKDEYMKKFLALANALSPENLWQDGEATPAQARRQAAALTRQWRALEVQIGQQVDECEVYLYAQHSRPKAR